MKATLKDLYIALGEGLITVEQLIEVLVDNVGKRKAMKIIQRDIRKFLK